MIEVSDLIEAFFRGYRTFGRAGTAGIAVIAGIMRDWRWIDCRDSVKWNHNTETMWPKNYLEDGHAKVT